MQRMIYRNAFKGMHCNTEYEKELHFKKLIKFIKATRVQFSPYEGKTLNVLFVLRVVPSVHVPN
jgi:hypothetical protein